MWVKLFNDFTCKLLFWFTEAYQCNLMGANEREAFTVFQLFPIYLDQRTEDFRAEGSIQGRVVGLAVKRVDAGYLC